MSGSGIGCHSARGREEWKGYGMGEIVLEVGRGGEGMGWGR